MKGNRLVMKRRERLMDEPELESISVFDPNGYLLTCIYVCTCVKHSGIDNESWYLDSFTPPTWT